MILIAYPASIFEVNKRLSAHNIQSLLSEETAQVACGHGAAGVDSIMNNTKKELIAGIMLLMIHFHAEMTMGFGHSRRCYCSKNMKI
jgi:hypothetical protein